MIPNGPYVLRLPVVQRHYPPLPLTPVLEPIDDSDGDGAYEIRWNETTLALTYDLDEDWQGTGWYGAYSGAFHSANMSNRPAGRYAYRCRSRNLFGESGWSEVQVITVGGTVPGSVDIDWSEPVINLGKAQFKVVNDSPYRLRFEFTGPLLFRVMVPECVACGVYGTGQPSSCPMTGRPIDVFSLDPGSYRVYATATGPDIRRYVGRWQADGDRRHLICFSVVSP
jgi:hypothetical protein